MAVDGIRMAEWIARVTLDDPTALEAAQADPTGFIRALHQRWRAFWLETIL